MRYELLHRPDPDLIPPRKHGHRPYWRSCIPVQLLGVNLTQKEGGREREREVCARDAVMSGRH